MAVHDLAQQALADHVEDRQVVAAIAPVLQHHVGHAGLFVRIDQFPALLERERRGHLAGGVLAGLHGIHRHRDMPLPRGRNDHRVEVVAGHHSLEVVLVPRISFGFGPAGLLHARLGCRHPRDVDVANRRDPHLLEREQEA